MVVAVERLLERDTELELIGAALDGARKGIGSFLVLTGPAGIGKTRLARAAREEAEERGFGVLTSRGAELERDHAFGVVRQWFEPLLRGKGEQEWLEGAAGFAAPVLQNGAAESADPSFSSLHGLYWFVANLAERRPLMLILDDAQWSDEASLRFVGFLARRLDGLPALLMVTARESATGLHAELASESSAEVLELRPLGANGVARFLRDRSDGVVDDAFALACRDATGGNPFLLAELARTLSGEGTAFVAEQAARVGTVGPRGVATAVLRRVSSLSVETTRLARAAAIAGDDSPLQLVAALGELDEATAADAADALAEAGVLEDARPLRFVHPIVREAIQNSVSAGGREALHQRAATLLAESGAPPEIVAVHLLALAPRGNEETAATLVEAAAVAISRGAPEAAETLLTRALAEPPPADARPRILLDLGHAEHTLQRPTAVEHIREAHRLSTDPRERARAALLLTWAIGAGLREQRELLELLDEAIEKLPAEDRELALELEAARMSAAWDRGLIDAVLARADRFGDLQGRTPGECLVLAYLAHVRMDAGRSAAEVAPLAARAAAVEFVPNLGPDSFWALHAGIVLRQAERIDAALDLLSRGIAEAQAQGSLRGFVMSSMFRSAVLHRAGDIEGAEADARAALAAAASEAVFVLPAVAGLIDALIDGGRHNEAVRLLETYELTEAVPVFRHGTVLLFSRSWLRFELGDLPGALEDLCETRRRLDRAGNPSIVGLDGRVRTALIHKALGDDAQAVREAEVALEAARNWGTAGAIGIALRAWALVHEEMETLRESVSELARSPLRLEQARAMVDLGAALRRAGKRSESRGPLRQALALADECGGIAVRERAREELAATGIRVPRETLSGVAALTPSERRIAIRAAAGASNPEIAQALFVTVKTVEMHLSNAYRKLGIAKRQELAGTLREPRIES